MGKDLKIILWFLRPYAPTVLLIFLFLFIFTVLEAVSIGAFYPLLSSVMAENPMSPAAGGRVLALLGSLARRLGADGVVGSSAFLLGIVITSAVFGLFAESFAMWHRYKLLEDFLNKVYRKITTSQYLYFLEKRQGELIYVGVNAAQSVGEMLMYFPKVGVEFFRLLTITALLLTISVKITLAVLALMLVFGVMVHFLSVKAIHPLAVRIQQADSGLTSLFSESMSGIKQIKIFDSHGFWHERFAAQAHETRAAATMNAVLGFIPSRLIMVVGTLSIVLAILYVKGSAPERLAGFLPLIAIYVLALQRMMPAINNIGSYWMGLKGLAPRLELTHRTLTETGYDEEEGRGDFLGIREGLRIENLSFSYPSRKGVLKNVKIFVPKGGTVAIVGESGSGKSTLSDLLVRLYEPSSGRILADGVDIRELSRRSWLARIGVVTQDTFIFHATVKENIRMGKPSASDEQVHRAAEIAYAHQFIVELPEGYDTLVGDRGVKLSGGQRQRIAIARAIIRDPEVLILDEATSALDNISETTVQEALNRAGSGRTTIVIAHRLSTVENADKIVVMSAGEIAEEGVHAELLRKKGVYFGLYQKQKEEAKFVA